MQFLNQYGDYLGTDGDNGDIILNNDTGVAYSNSTLLNTDNSARIATTAFVQAQKNNPSFTGVQLGFCPSGTKPHTSTCPINPVPTTPIGYMLPLPTIVTLPTRPVANTPVTGTFLRIEAVTVPNSVVPSTPNKLILAVPVTSTSSTCPKPSTPVR